MKGFEQKPMMLLTNIAENEELQAEGKDGTDHSQKVLRNGGFNEVPEFFPYALADGIRRAFSRYGEWGTKAAAIGKIALVASQYIQIRKNRQRGEALSGRRCD